MKLKGIDLGKPYVEFVVIPRGEGGNIVFQAQAVIDYKPFYDLCPLPQAPKGIRRNKATGVMEDFNDVENPAYTTAVGVWSLQKVSWMVIQSLAATEGLEWDTVVPNDPTTWPLYEKELRDAAFSASEIDRIIDGVTTVCGLNEAKIAQATKDFLAGRAVQA